jgi:hypothetical protein
MNLNLKGFLLQSMRRRELGLKSASNLFRWKNIVQLEINDLGRLN